MSPPFVLELKKPPGSGLKHLHKRKEVQLSSFFRLLRPTQPGCLRTYTDIKKWLRCGTVVSTLVSQVQRYQLNGDLKLPIGVNVSTSDCLSQLR